MLGKPRRKKGESIESYNKRICVMYRNSGYYIDEIAKKTKLSQIEVYNAITTYNNITTESEREEMLAMRSAGLSLSQIANALGKSRSCVRARLKSPAKIKINSKNKLTDKQIKKLNSMVKDGCYIKTIAEELNISENTIKYRMKNSETLKRTSNRVTNEEVNKFIKLFNKGYTYAKIAEECDRCASTVSKHLRKLGYNR